jgi:hypothetical protein
MYREGIGLQTYSYCNVAECQAVLFTISGQVYLVLYYCDQHRTTIATRHYASRMMLRLLVFTREATGLTYVNVKVTYHASVVCCVL